MKTSARFLAMLLAVVMIAGAALSASAFDDIAGNDHANAINVLNQLGVIGGYEDGTFKPDQKVTRAEMAKLVYVLYTTFVDAGAGATAFNDVAADNWAAGYIRWCSQMGIIGGYGNGKFGPTDNVTYDQALKMVCGVLGYNEWDSNLWPTDVRMKALRELNLGKELDGVNGNDQLTRAQVAQIMYNALNADMKETKSEPVVIGGLTINVPVPKTLQEDIWKVAEIEGLYVSSVDAAKGEITLSADVNGKRTHKLADLGLEAYEGKEEALVGLHLVALTKNGKLLGGLAVKGSVVDGVEVKYNKALDTLTVAGVDYKATEEEDEVNIKVNGVDAFKDTKNDKDAYEITETVKGLLDKAYFARAIDVDGDAKVDELKVVTKTAYKAGTPTTGKEPKITLSPLDGSASKTYAVADINITLAKDDIVVAAEMAGKVYAEKVEAVETYATKISGTKATLATGDVISFADLKVAGVKEADVKLTTANLSEEAKTGYYIYNGELILCEAVKVASDYKFAVLKEIVEKEGEVDKETMTSANTYVATIIVDGKEEEVTLKSTEALVIGGETKTAAEAYAIYKSTTALDETVTPAVNRIVYNYALISTYTEKDGLYTLTLNKKLGDEDILATSGTISYDAKTTLYTVAGTKRVVLDDASVIFYPYVKETTGNFKWLGNYTKETITKKNFEATLTVAYLAKNTNGTYTLLAAVVTDEIKGSADDTKVDYTTKGSLITYAYADASATVGEDGKIYYEYSFLDNATLTNKAAAVDTTKTVEDGAVETKAGKFYAWDATNEKYVEVASTENTFKYATLTNMIEFNNILEYNDGAAKEVSIADTVKIWGLGLNEEDEAVLDEYVTLTAAELREMIELAKEAEKTVNAIIVSDKNEEDEYDIVTIIVEIFEANEDEVVSINNSLFPELV